MMNSRTRRRPPFGRGSSRSLIWKWYQSCGSCLYELISRAWKVAVSSWGSGRMNRRPERSCVWKIASIDARPVASQSSTGVSTGISISWPPIASISSRMICSILRCTRQPSGSHVHRPALTCRMKPPRTSSLCETASASAGGSRRVGRNSFEARAIIVAGPGYRDTGLVERDGRRLGHRERGRLRHLQPLRPVHPVLDPAVDLVEQLVDQDVGRHLLQHPAVGVDEADVAAAGDAEVGVARLPRPVDGAAHHRDLERLRVRAEPLLDDAGEALHADV